MLFMSLSGVDCVEPCEVGRVQCFIALANDWPRSSTWARHFRNCTIKELKPTWNPPKLGIMDLWPHIKQPLSKPQELHKIRITQISQCRHLLPALWQRGEDPRAPLPRPAALCIAWSRLTWNEESWAQKKATEVKWPAKGPQLPGYRDSRSRVLRILVQRWDHYPWEFDEQFIITLSTNDARNCLISAFSYGFVRDLWRECPETTVCIQYILSMSSGSEPWLKHIDHWILFLVVFCTQLTCLEGRKEGNQKGSFQENHDSFDSFNFTSNQHFEPKQQNHRTNVQWKVLRHSYSVRDRSINFH